MTSACCSEPAATAAEASAHTHPDQASMSGCSSSTCLASLTSLVPPLTAAGKSIKRRAAEALLASRYSSSGVVDLASNNGYDRFADTKRSKHTIKAGSTPAGSTSSSTSSGSSSGTGQPPGSPGSTEARPDPIQVAECAPSCSFPQATGSSWCQFKVEVPHVQWHKVFTENPASVPMYRVAAGYQKWYMPEGVQVLLVESAEHLPDALAKLKASMRDPVVAIDLEWRPQSVSGRFSPVALIQLATSTTSLLIRTCRMQFKLHPALLEFLVSPQVVVVGFSWATSDEAKMQATFQMGAQQVFGSFHDVQDIAVKLGYPPIGLGRLTKQVLGLDMPKPKRVTMSNWEAGHLTHAQVKYAALDALVTGMLYRVLRLWHASSSPCAVCRQPLGALLPKPAFSCPGCGGREYFSLNGLLQHAREAQHAVHHEACSGCGRVRRAPTARVPPPLRPPGRPYLPPQQQPAAQGGRQQQEQQPAGG